MTARGIRHRFVSEMHRNELPEFWAELGLLSSPRPVGEADSG